jgi:hypothetical protein
MIIHIQSLAYNLAQKYGTAGRCNHEQKAIEAAFQKFDVSLFNRNPS